jgi:divalent metal cation (Fe/Co/Zn/Cd) transporter
MKKVAIITGIVVGALVLILGVATVAYAVPRLYLSTVVEVIVTMAGLVAVRMFPVLTTYRQLSLMGR